MHFGVYPVRVAPTKTETGRRPVPRGADAWRPRPRPVRSEWCCQHLWMPAKTSARPGRFELDDHAYLAEIIDAVDDPDVTEIVAVMVPQVGKTTLLQAVILSQGTCSAAPMMFASSTEDDVKEKRGRIYELAEASPALRDWMCLRR